MNTCASDKSFPVANVSGRPVADIASYPQPDEKLTKEGFIRSVVEVTETHVTYYRSSVHVPWLQHGKRCTRAGWANWAEGAERWEAQ